MIDFETRNSKRNYQEGWTSIWLYDFCSLKDFSHYTGYTMDDFMKHCSDIAPCTLYSHNLKFDGTFIVSWLLEQGYTYSEDQHLGKDGRWFTAIIDEMRNWYCIIFNVCRVKDGKKKIVNVKVQDSLKKINAPVRDIAESYGFDMPKGECDYTKDRPDDYIATSEEVSYIQRDTEIVARALRIQYENGFTHMTNSSDAFHMYEDEIGHNMFRSLFPVLSPEIDAWVRYAYYGGYCYVNPEYQGKVLDGVKCYDVNSLYPTCMYYDPLPYGQPLYFGPYNKVPDYIWQMYHEHEVTYIVSFSADISLKDGHMPSVAKQTNFGFGAKDYVTFCFGEMEELWLAEPDFKLMGENYDIDNIQFHDIMFFKCKSGLFKDYIDPIYEEKKNSKGAKKQLAKIRLNSLYGRFAMKSQRSNREPFLDEGGVLDYRSYQSKPIDPVYTPVAVFVTAHGRRRLFKMINDNLKNFVYSDTDSVHLVGDDPHGIILDKDALGACKIEHDFVKAKYLKPKCYMGQDASGAYEIKCAGMSQDTKELIKDFKEFNIGSVFTGKLRPEAVRGGTILVPTYFTIRPDF